MSDPVRAPRLVRPILSAVLPNAEPDFVLGDMHGELARRWHVHGRPHALGWYGLETARSLWPTLTVAHGWRDGTMTGWGGPYLDALGEAVRGVDANAVLARTCTMADLVTEDAAPTRFASRLLPVFGLVARLVLAMDPAATLREE